MKGDLHRRERRCTIWHLLKMCCVLLFTNMQLGEQKHNAKHVRTWLLLSQLAEWRTARFHLELPSSKLDDNVKKGWLFSKIYIYYIVPKTEYFLLDTQKIVWSAREEVRRTTGERLMLWIARFPPLPEATVLPFQSLRYFGMLIVAILEQQLHN